MLPIPTLTETMFLGPMILLFVAACIPITAKVLRRNIEPANIFSLVCGLVGTIAAAAVSWIQNSGAVSHQVYAGSLIFDGLSNYANQVVFLVVALTLLNSYQNVNTKGRSFAEHVFLIMTSAVGMLILTSANDLMVSFVGLEIMSICLYVLIGMGHEQHDSKEASFKYFILGSFASAVFLYGIALLFGSTGTTHIVQLGGSSLILAGTSRLFLIGVILLLVGIGFKVSLFPFHSWTPDVYQGAPTSVAGFMATGVKLVMFTFLLRLVLDKFASEQPTLVLALEVIAVLTMTVGNLTAIVQDNVKRMLAYSSVAHAGYILVGIIAVVGGGTDVATSGVLYYLLAYSIMNIGAFAVVSIFEEEEGQNLSVEDYAGLGFKYPLIGLALSVFMLSLAGIPPTAGFVGKFYVFTAALKQGYVWLVVFGVINSLISVYYYLRLLVYMYMKEPTRAVSANLAFTSRIAVTVTMALTLIVGVFSAPFWFG